MEKFRGVDYYGIETLLAEDERMIRDAVRDWVEAEFIPIVPEHHRAGTFPVALIPKLGELGVFGATLKGYGCAGLSNVAYGLIMQELERGDSGLRSCASVQSGLVMYPIYAYGSDAQKDRWLPVLATGQTVGCFGLPEPDHGSEPGAVRHRMGRRGRPHGVLRLGAAVRAAARAVRQADRLVSARAAEARLDAERDHQGPAPRAAARAAQGRRAGAAPAGLAGEDEQRAGRPGRRAHGPRYPRRRGHRGRAPDHPAHAESGDGEHLRGHPRHPHPHRGPRCNRARRVRGYLGGGPRNGPHTPQTLGAPRVNRGAPRSRR